MLVCGMRATEYCPVQPQLAVWALMTHIFSAALFMFANDHENTSGIDLGLQIHFTE